MFKNLRCTLSLAFSVKPLIFKEFANKEEGVYTNRKIVPIWENVNLCQLNFTIKIVVNIKKHFSCSEI